MFKQSKNKRIQGETKENHYGLERDDVIIRTGDRARGESGLTSGVGGGLLGDDAVNLRAFPSVLNGRPSYLRCVDGIWMECRVKEAGEGEGTSLLVLGSKSPPLALVPDAWAVSLCGLGKALGQTENTRPATAGPRYSGKFTFM